MRGLIDESFRFDSREIIVLVVCCSGADDGGADSADVGGSVIFKV